jgi:acyl-CoA reductase-like NAD-dependent aldehyde dehydrogenase
VRMPESEQFPTTLHSLVAGRPLSQEAAEGAVPVIDPWRNEPACLLAPGGRAGVEAAVQAARRAFLDHRRETRAARAGWLEAAAAAIAAAEPALTGMIVRCIGKPRRAAAFEVKRAAAFIRACAAAIHDFRGETIPLDSSPAGAGRFGFTERVPYGVVAAVTPFNAPANLLVQKIAPALVTGNAVVVKPAPEGASVAIEIARLFIEAGLPAGLLSVVLGGPDEALALAAHPDVAVVTLTGGTAAGEALARAAGAKPFLGELGGNSPNIVCADADLADAVARIVPSSFEASGQQCISTQRIIVEAPVFDAFETAFVAAARALKAGDPDDPGTDLGPVVHMRAADRICGMIDAAIAAGARCLTGPERQGCLIRPTVLSRPPRDAAVVQQEIFGPVVVLMSAADVDEAIEIANDCEFGLQASCFTRSLDVAMRMGRDLRTGSVWINEASRFRLDNYPFGGFGKSGSGREGVTYAMDEYTTYKFTGIRMSQDR